MINYIIYRCQYDTVPENLSGPPQKSPHTLREKLTYFSVICFFRCSTSKRYLGLELVLVLGLVLKLF